MARIERSIEVDVPVRTAYNQWTQFEEFPRFMEGVREVRQIDDTHIHWYAEIAGKDKEWDAEITEQVPDQRISWRSISGAENAGSVTFAPLAPNRTRVNLMIDYDPEGFLENVGDVFGITSRRVEGDLERFKQFVESRGQETGQWRGEVHHGQTTSPGSGQASGLSSPSAGMGAPGLRESPGQQAGTSAGSMGGTAAPMHSAGGGHAGSATAGTGAGAAQQGGMGSHVGSTGEMGEYGAASSGRLGSTGTSGAMGGYPSSSPAGSDTTSRYGPESTRSASSTSGMSSGGGSWAGNERRYGERRKATVTQMQPGASSTGVTRHGRTGQSWLPSAAGLWEDPMGTMRRMSQEMDQLFDRFLRGPGSSGQDRGSMASLWSPQIEVSQRGDQLMVCADLPGIRKEDVQIEFNDGMLTIEGERRTESEQSEGGYRHSERTYGHFYRTIPLPEGINPDEARASMHDGVLEITLPAPQRAGGRRIQIEGGEQQQAVRRSM